MNTGTTSGLPGTTRPAWNCGWAHFGRIETSATGLLHLMLAEFGLIYSNDWFMLPHPMDVNTVCEIRGILVDDTFGRHTYIRPAGRGPETAWQRFTFFHLTERVGRDAANRFYLVPTVGHALEGPPLERVNFLRDEMANMAWGVESIVPSQTGVGMDGNDQSRPAAPEPDPAQSNDVKIRYEAGTTVPANWIPFIPVHLEGSQRDPAAAGPDGRREASARSTAARTGLALLHRGGGGPSRRGLRRAVVAADALVDREDDHLGGAAEDCRTW